MNKLALITGATGKIGYAIAQGLAAVEDMELILAGRSRERTAAAAQSLTSNTGNSRVTFDLCDVSRKISTDALFASLSETLPGDRKIDILINNAAVAPRERKITPEGLELQWATNVMGYYWMIESLKPILSDHARIVNVASYFAGGLNLTDPMFEKREYTNNSAYRASKQADRMLTRGLAQKYPRMSILACHPGDVYSTLSTDLGYGGSETPEKGAKTPLYAALSPEMEGRSGEYIENMKITPCPFMEDEEGVLELLRLCKSMS